MCLKLHGKIVVVVDADGFQILSFENLVAIEAADVLNAVTPR
jgi:hypothetical protein